MSPITLPLAELKPALTGLGKVISKRATLPVLHHLKIERTPDGWIALTATDLDCSATVRLEQPSVGEPLSLLVPCDALLKISKGRGKDEEIFLIADDNNNSLSMRAAIGDQFAETKVESLPVEEFPALPQIGGAPIALNAALRSAIQQALECASIDETRLILNGAYLDVSKPKAHYVVGTDGRHLFSSNSFALPLQESVLIPSHRFLGWKEFHADGEWQLQVAPKDKDNDPPPFQISSRRWQFISRQIAGNYPNWRQVVPDGSGIQTTIDIEPESVESIQQTITRMPDYDEVNHRLGLEVIGHQLRLVGSSSKDGDWTRVIVEGAKIKGKEVITFLNRNLLAKALRFGLTKIEIIDAMSPLKFSEGGRQMIVMPVRGETAPSKAETPPVSAPVAADHEEPTVPAPVPANSPEPTAPPRADQPERKPMPEKPNGHANAATATTNVAEKPALETALAQIEIVRGDFRNAIAGLNKLGDLLKQAQREQKAGDKEVQSVRQTLRSLQSVRI